MPQFRFKLHFTQDGLHYVRDENGWSLDDEFITLEAKVGVLETALVADLIAEDKATDDPMVLLHRASIAKALDQHARAESLCRRVLRSSVQILPALAMLSAALRAQGDPQSAIDETDGFDETDYTPLLTSRAAALCDVGRWADARRLATQALELQPSDEAYNVLQRIERHMPAPSDVT